MNPGATAVPEPREVLGIEVDGAGLLRWREWLMPAQQPYVVPRAVATRLWLREDRARLSPELRDSFSLYRLDADARLCWLDRGGARRLPPEVRAAQPAAHHFPTPDVARDVAVCARVVAGTRRPSRHADVPAAVWRDAAALAPRARALAGRFPGRSGTNCFGAVLGASGVAGAEERWVDEDEFEEWLEARTDPTESVVNGAGTVYVWRGGDGRPAHAALCLGGGYALHKPSQGWMSPTLLLTTREVIVASRAPGLRLHRHVPRGA